MRERLLAAYAELLQTRAIDLGLISERDRERVRVRHVDDSLRAAELIAPGARVCDIGSGAGLPGIPLAIAVPDASFVLVEPRRRAVAFLELVVDSLGLHNVRIEETRIEDVALEADVVTARAFGALDRSWTAACRVLSPGGRLVYFAGESFDRAVIQAVEHPERPADVRIDRVESRAALVIMSREE